MLKTIIFTYAIWLILLSLLFSYCIAEEKKIENTITTPTATPLEAKKEEENKGEEKEESKEEKPMQSEVLEKLKKLLHLEDAELGIPIQPKPETQKPQPPATFPKPEQTIKPQPPTPPAKPEQTIKPQQPAQTKKTEKEKPIEEKEPNMLNKVVDFLFGKDPSKIRRQQPEYDFSQREQEEKREKYQVISQITPEIEGTSLQESIKRAIENSPEVNKAKIEAELIRRQNTFTPVPTFQVGNDLATGKTMISAGISLPLEPLFTGKQREKYGQLNIEQKKLEVERKIAEQYKKIATLNKKLESKEKKRAHANQLASNAEEQYKGGLIRLDELIKAKELLWSAEYEVESLKLEIETETERLKSIERGGK